MTKRMLGGLLWFGTICFGFEVLWSLTGVPRVIGPVLGGLVAIVVALDPTGGLWAARPGGSSHTITAQALPGESS